MDGERKSDMADGQTPKNSDTSSIADKRKGSVMDQPIDLDYVLVNEIGQFGRYQMFNLLLVSVPIIMSAFMSEYIFSAAAIPHRCRVPECGETTKTERFNPNWVLNAIPPASNNAGFASCDRYIPIFNNGSLDYCPSSLFQQQTQKCDGFVYARDNSCVYDFDLGCQDWLRALAGTLNSVGTLLVLPIAGYISDTFGRRVALVISVVNLGLFGIIRAFSVNYPMYLAFQLLQTTFGAGTFSSSYIFATEFVGPKYRVLTSATCTSMFAVGQVILGAVAWVIQPWRYMILALHIPCFIIIAYYWILQESVRWLLSQKKYDQAKDVLERVARRNRKQISEKSLHALMNPPEPVKVVNGDEPNLFQAIFRSGVLLRRVCTTPIWWITTTFVYYGLSINATSLSDSMYLNYILTCAIEIPGFYTAVLILDRIGRKPTLSGGYLFSAACNIAFAFIPNDLSTLRLIVYLFGKFGISVVFTSLYLFTSELYPTQYRHRLLAFSSMVGRIGSITAPLTPLLMDYWDGIPSVMFGAMGILSGILVLTQPETLEGKNNRADGPAPENVDSSNIADEPSAHTSQFEKRKGSVMDQPIDLDYVLVNEIGQFGRYQMFNLLLVSVPIIMSAFMSEYIFSAAAIPHRCRVPECGETTKSERFEPEWVLNAIPSADNNAGFASCDRYIPIFNNGSLDYCPSSLFQQQTQKCDGFVYARDNSCVYDFDLGCQDWLRALAGTLSSVGTLLVLPIAGYISDTFGRRVALVISVVNLAIFGIIRAFSVNYPMYLAFQLLQTTFGAGTFSSSYIFATEFVGPKYRVLTSATCSSMFAVGQVILGAVAWVIQPWRYMILALHIPCFIIIAYYWILQESVRWLLSQKKYDQAKDVLERVARRNRKQISEKSLHALMNPPEPVKVVNGDEPNLFQAIFRSGVLLRRVCTTPIWWITTTFVYYGLSINATSLSDSMYLNYILTCAIEIPGFYTAVLILDRIGRKPTLSGGYLFSAACNIAFAFIPNDLSTLRLIVYLFGKFGISVVFTSLYLFTSELYPTQYRHRLLAFSSMVGRIGSITAPLTPVLMDYWDGIPSVMFGAMGILSGILVLTQPETLGTKMPDTLAEAEALGKPESKIKT
ncbi:hypothetical protein HW555_005367 [Spodoptera exigua]|uniref:Major facilitator superfamily (MFS) profile domain-containing protein n=1 Tax=Spodoptera exigua TaxID=7107 RepID=A0A835GGK5_SPOEX|nr:hypothetical protein HW555_005367 [Spodoptera exigua]